MSNKETQLYTLSEADFADEYQSKELDLGYFNGYPFHVVVQEIPHGKYTKLQQNFIGKMHLTDSEAAHKKQLEEKEVDPIDYVDNRALAGVARWTLKKKNGMEIPVCDAAWGFLPHRLTELIEKGIKDLNPTMVEDFRAELADTSGDLGESSQEKQAI